MPVYVDKSAHAFGRMTMCHMIADTPAELRAMALKIGVQLRWFQATASAPHFDICKSKKALAIAAGAIELEMRPYVEVLKRIKKSWPRTTSGLWQLDGFDPVQQIVGDQYAGPREQ